MTILQSLAKFYERLEGRGEHVPQPGYAPVRIAFVLEIDRDGTPRSLIDKRDVSQRKPVAPTIMMPSVSRTSGIKPAFLWDKTSYVFGVTALEVETDAGKKVVAGQAKRTLEEHEAFRLAHIEALAQSSDEGLVALRLFVERWTPDQWNSLGFTSDALDENIAFRLRGDDRRIDERDAAREISRSSLAPGGKTAPCLITGRVGPYAVLQPQFKGVRGAQSSGAPLVSFNAKAFESYGMEGGANAPVSEKAAFRYGAALNWLLDRANSRSFRLGETTVVFWADEKEGEVGEASALAAEEVFWGEFAAQPERDADAEEADTIRTGLEEVKGLRAAPDIKALKPETRLHILGLSPNSGRIAVRFWLVDTYGHLKTNLKRHVDDLGILPRAFPTSGMPKPYALVLELVPASIRKDRAKVDKLLQSKWMAKVVGEMFFAVISGRAYPQTLLATLIARIRADKFVAAYRKDGSISGARVALCVATINRRIRLHEGSSEEEIPLAFDPENMNPAYRLGRLFALIEGAQKAALPKLNATVKDRFFGSASATPSRVFPLLHKNAMNHLAAVRKEKGAGLAAWMEKEIGQVWSGLSDDLPRSLRLEDQGRFIAGYYHQRFSKLATTPAEVRDILASDPEGASQ